MPEHPSKGDFSEQPDPESTHEDLDEVRTEFAYRMLRLQEQHVIENPSPKTWPCYPLLCMIHRTERDHDSPFPKPGLIHAGQPTTIAAINLYDLPAYGGTISGEELDKRLIRYDSVEALLKDWKID